MKNTVFVLSTFLISAVLFLLAYSNYDARWSPKARQGLQNQQNIKKVSLGMNAAEVTDIMGKPTYVNRIESAPRSTSYNYQMPPGSSAYCDIDFGSTGKVTRIYCLAK